MNASPSISRRVAVIGAGISGLAAAHRLREIDPGCQPMVFERGSRLGGVIQTVHQAGFQVEQSADNFITTVPWGVDLCKRIGLGGELIHTNPAHRQTYVVRRGRLHKLPDGFLMMAPARMWPLAVTPILSPMGKLRAALEYLIPPRRREGDESMAAFVRRRLGREVFDRLVEPLVSAVYAADMERLSLNATLSQFREMELAHGSLIRAMRSRMKEMRHQPKAGSGDSGARYSMFVTPRDGLESIVGAIATRLPPGSVRLDTPVEQMEPAAGGRWNLRLGGSIPGGLESFDAVILSTPSHEAGRLLATVAPALGADLASIEHSGTAIVSAGYRREQVVHPLNGMGVVVPALEKSSILACSFSSQKYAHRAPDGHVLLRIFAGGALHPELASMPDEELRPLALGELDRFLGIRGEPVYLSIAHWPRTMPQYHVGHKDLIARIEAAVRKIPNLALAGNAYHGVGIPHCIHSGEQAAESVCV
jgi:oxygen-dependent protoporphyrinogen oxidase